MSATIYEFPARGRYAVGGQHEEAKSAAMNFTSPNFVSSRNMKAVISNGWYHDEAIEAERLLKN
jgi:hypothetical protein